MKPSILVTGLLVLMGSHLIGCATTQALHTESSNAAIRSAEELGAHAVPQAALHLQLAKEGEEAAIALNAKGLHEEAKSMLLRAAADAELAVALAREDAEKTAAEAAIARVRQLQSENPSTPAGAP